MIKKLMIGTFMALAIIIIYRSVYAPDGQKRMLLVSEMSIEDMPVLQQDSKKLWPFENEQGMNAIFGNEITNWENVRQEDGGNCGYHAIKNVSLALESLEHEGVINDIARNQMNNEKILYQRILFQAPEIAEQRLTLVQNELAKKGLAVDDRSPDYLPDYLKDVRPSLGFLKDYVSSNDGHIKTDFLSGDEVEHLLKKFSDNAIVKKMAVIEYDLDLVRAGIPVLTPETMRKIADFKAGRIDHLGVIWNEKGFNHWVGYTVSHHPTTGKIIVHRFNSATARTPLYESALLNMLGQ